MICYFVRGVLSQANLINTLISAYLHKNDYEQALVEAERLVAVAETEVTDSSLYHCCMLMFNIEC